MGVLKNEVGRPSKKTKIIRGVLKIIGILIVVAVAFYVGYVIKDNEDKKKKDDNYKTEENIKEDNYNEENTKEKLNVNDEKLVSLFNRFNGFNEYLDIMYDIYSDGRINYEPTSLSSYFYINDSLENEDLSDEIKFGVSFYDIYLSDNQDFNIFDSNFRFYLSEINKKSKELFGSEVNVNNILYSNNYVNVGVLGAVFEYNGEDKSFTVVGGGVGASDSSSYYTKIIKAEQFNDRIEITNKVIFVYQAANENGNNTIKVFKNVTNDYDNGFLGLSDEIDDLGETTINSKIIDDYVDDANSFKWTFKKDAAGNYIFEKVEKID